MKHFGAVLSGDNNIVDGGESSILTIGTAATNNDSIIIHNEDPASLLALKAITDFGLVIVPTTAVSVDGTTGAISHLLGADGREVAVTDVGGGVNDNLSIPISTGSTFVNSRISQDITTATGAATISIGASDNADTVVIRGNLQIEGSTTEIESTTTTVNDRFINLGNTAAGATTTDLTGGIIVETDNDGAGTKVYGGLRFNGGTNSWQISTDTSSDGITSGTWADLGVSGQGVQSVVGAAGITVDTLVANGRDVNNPAVAIALTPEDAAAGGIGGLGFTGTGDARTVGVATDGIDEQHLNVPGTAGLAGQVLSLSNTTTGAFEWVTAATGTVQKYVHVGNKAAADVGFTIDATDQGDSSPFHGLTGQDFTIVLYELITDGVGALGGYRQFIPESVLIQNGTGTGEAGAVVVNTGATAADLAYKIIIKS